MFSPAKIYANLHDMTYALPEANDDYTCRNPHKNRILPPIIQLQNNDRAVLIYYL